MGRGPWLSELAVVYRDAQRGGSAIGQTQKRRAEGHPGAALN
ncbi:MAG: hypothetical protein WAO78_06525 [Roseovarius sp.]